MLKTKFYGNAQKSKMYVADVNSEGLIRSLKLWGPDKKVLLKGEIDPAKDPIRFSELKKEGGLEYILFLLYYPGMLLKSLKGVPTKLLPSVLKSCDIKNEQLVKNILALRRARGKKPTLALSAKKLPRKR